MSAMSAAVTAVRPSSTGLRSMRKSMRASLTSSMWPDTESALVVSPPMVSPGAIPGARVNLEPRTETTHTLTCVSATAMAVMASRLALRNWSSMTPMAIFVKVPGRTMERWLLTEMSGASLTARTTNSNFIMAFFASVPSTGRSMIHTDRTSRPWKFSVPRYSSLLTAALMSASDP